MDEALPDILAPGLLVVFCGINPGKKSASVGHPFVGGNRFWRVLYLAGFTPMQILPEHDYTLLNYRCGLTTVVDRATVRANEVSKHEFLAGASTLEQKMKRYAPQYIAFLGKAAYAALRGQREVQWGAQPDRFGGAQVWVLPNPSGLNRGFSLDNLVQAYRQLRLATEAKNLLE